MGNERRVRILAYNVQSCRAGVDRVADVIRRAASDVAAINEVRRGQALRIGKLTGMHVAFGATLRWRRFGNAVLTRERPIGTRSLRFSVVRGREPRGMVAAVLPGGFRAVAVHLGRPAEERQKHMTELLAALQGVSRRLAVAGDLNERSAGPAVRLIASHLRDASVGTASAESPTYPASAPRIRIDYVFVSPDIRVLSAAVLPEVASDHLAVVADLEI